MGTSCSDAARAAIRNLETGWTTVEPAVDATGRRCPSWHDAAVAWTFLGSVSGARGVTDRARLLLLGKIAAVTRKTGHPTTLEGAIATLRKCVEDDDADGERVEV